jgi:hypothetical protein
MRHRLRGHPSNRRLPAALCAQVVKVVKVVQVSYANFGPTVAEEYLGKWEGIKISKEAVRKLLIAAGVWRARPLRVKMVHRWRPREW